MGAIAGLLHRDGTPADTGDVNRLHESLGRHARSGVATTRVEGQVALLHASLPSTPEAVGEIQPVVDAASQCQLVFVGRIDNRDDLLAALRMGPASTDAQLALGAFLRWDTASFHRTIGDFALAVWDPSRRRAICARDAVGFKPLYYASCGPWLAWSSDLTAVLAPRWLTLAPNERMVAEHLLIDGVLSVTDTLYEGVQRLPPAHFLIADSSGIRVERYWDIDPARRIRYRSDHDYADHLRDLLTEAVRCRMRTPGSLFTELSGGVDSSAVTAIAQSLSPKEGVALEALSIIYPGMGCDESPFIDEVERFTAVKSRRFLPRKIGTYDYYRDATATGDCPISPVAATSTPIPEFVRRSDGHAILTGAGGDAWFQGSPLILADDLRRLRWATLARRLTARDRLQWLADRGFRKGALRPLVKQWIPERLVEIGRSRRPLSVGSSCITASFAAKVGLGRELAPPPRLGGWTDLARADIYEYLSSGRSAYGLEIYSRDGMRYGLERRAPYYDRRIIEFAIAIPQTQHMRPTQTKGVLRHAVEPFLPAAVTWRRDKAEFSALIAEEALAAKAELLHSPLLTEQLGWVDGRRLRETYGSLNWLYHSGDPGYYRHAWPVWRALAVEVWYRACFGPGGQERN